MKRITISLIVLILILLTIFFYYKYSRNGIYIKPNDVENMIVLTSPIKDSQISSPLRIVGRARGAWFFEGSFPVSLIDSYGNVIASGSVSAQGKWATEEFVPFLGTLQFNNYIKGSKGTLILKKDNPSGLLENDASIDLPIIFK